MTVLPTQLGIVIEPAATNLVVQSQDLTQASWAKFGCTVSSSFGVAPDNTITATPITIVSGGTPHPYVNETFDVTSGTAMTFSGFFRRTTGDTEVIFELNSQTNGRATIVLNLVSGVVDTTLFTGWTKNASITQPLIGSWYYVAVNATPLFTATAQTQLNLYQTASSDPTVLGTTVGSVMSAWGLGVAVEDTISSYFPTTSTSGTRDADVVTLTLANATYDILVEDTAGAEFRSAVVVGAGSYTLAPRSGKTHVTRVRVWPSTGTGSLTTAQKAAIAPG